MRDSRLRQRRLRRIMRRRKKNLIHGDDALVLEKKVFCKREMYLRLTRITNDLKSSFKASTELKLIAMQISDALETKL